MGLMNLKYPPLILSRKLNVKLLAWDLALPRWLFGDPETSITLKSGRNVNCLGLNRKRKLIYKLGIQPNP